MAHLEKTFRRFAAYHTTGQLMARCSAVPKPVTYLSDDRSSSSSKKCPRYPLPTYLYRPLENSQFQSQGSCPGIVVMGEDSYTSKCYIWPAAAGLSNILMHCVIYLQCKMPSDSN